MLLAWDIRDQSEEKFRGFHGWQISSGDGILQSRQSQSVHAPTHSYSSPRKIVRQVLRTTKPPFTIFQLSRH
jgi:hypothetical protein